MNVAARPLYLAEPPAVYLFRPAIVVDCSVLAAVLFDEPLRDAALQRLTGRALQAPTLIDHEMASVALKKGAQGWPSKAVAAALEGFMSQTIELHRCDVAEQCDLAHRYGLSAYDAAYLWLAASLKAPLATFDRRLGVAAQRHLSALE